MFVDLLRRRKKTVLERWFRTIAAVYPKGTAEFLNDRNDRFRNPVGFTIRHEIDVLFDRVVTPGDPDRGTAALDTIMSIKAVQQCAPSQAVGLVFLLKEAIADTVRDEVCEAGEFREWMAFERRIDALILEAIDIYVRRREKIYDIRVKEVARDRDRVLRVMHALGSLDTDVFVGGEEKAES